MAESERTRIAKLSCLLFVIVWIGGVAASHGFLNSQEPGGAKIPVFMRLKLEPMKGVLEGIALEDYASISKNAGVIRNLLLDENWMVLQTEDYRRRSDEFRKTVEQLRDAASRKSIDGATLAYVQMTLQCVQCHQSLRK